MLPVRQQRQAHVYEKVVAADGSKSQQVDIYCKSIGCINRKLSPASYAAPEKAALQEHPSSLPKLPENDLGEPHGGGSP